MLGGLPRQAIVTQTWTWENTLSFDVIGEE